MSGFWEALFREERQDWSTCIVSHLSSLVTSIASLPALIAGLIMTAVLSVWDMIAYLVAAISEVLLLAEWWTLEHTVAVVVLTGTVVMLLRRGRGNWMSLLGQFNGNLQALASFGCFLWLAAGLQGGVVFGGKLFFPTLALFSVAFQLTRAMHSFVVKEIVGYVEKNEVSSSEIGKVLVFFGRILCLKASLAFSVATFGMPHEGDYLPLISLFPLVGLMRLALEYCKPEATVVTDNGSATKILDEEEPAETVAASGEAEAETPAVVEEKKEEPVVEAAEEPEKTPEVEEEEKPAEPAKVSVMAKLNKFFFCGVSAIKNLIDLEVKIVVNMINKIVSLPWNSIVEITASTGTTLTMALAYWTLTEDHAVWLIPICTRVLPLVAAKAEAMNWVSAGTVFLANEASNLMVAGAQYYLFRSYISLPF